MANRRSKTPTEILDMLGRLDRDMYGPIVDQSGGVLRDFLVKLGIKSADRRHEDLMKTMAGIQEQLNEIDKLMKKMK